MIRTTILVLSSTCIQIYELYNFIKITLEIYSVLMSDNNGIIPNIRICITVSVSVVNMVSVHNDNLNLTINLCIQFSVETSGLLYCRLSDNIILNYKV